MELIRTPDERANALAEYLRALHDGPVTRDTHDRYAHVLSTATAYETNGAIHDVLETARDIAGWELPVARFLRSVSAALDHTPLPEYPEGHLLAGLTAENTLCSAALANLASAVRETGSGPISGLIRELEGLATLAHHYERLQNELFPLYEESFNDHACVRLMWLLEDKVLALRKSLLSLAPGTRLENGSGPVKALGNLFTIAGSLVWREERILYPIAWRVIAQERFEYSDEKGAEPAGLTRSGSVSPAFVSLTGSLSSAELEAIFKVLPVDVSFIDADDRVKFYSDPPHRIFPRSPAVVGRLVQNCHPPKSVATVERILASFRDGSRDREEFWLNLNGRFIFIEYFAVRSPQGAYMGTLEVSRDATALRALEGEKRLL